jgi:class 3 adenylate cyclase/pimeloyl-ACP methyl ester carboxylesterase
MDIPEVHWAETVGGENIAYQCFGRGPVTLVFVNAWVNHLEACWELGQSAALLRQLAAFAQVIFFDARGTGMSDRVAAVPNLEQRAEDILAVMRATGTEQAALIGFLDGAALAAFFAATQPDRTVALVFCGFPRSTWAPDFPWGVKKDEDDKINKRLYEIWGDERHVDEFTRLIYGDIPLPTDPEWARQHARWARLAATPTSMMTFSRMWQQSDVRDILPSIHVPTLVMAGTDDQDGIDVGRYVAERIPGATLVLYPGNYATPFIGDSKPLTEMVREFLGAPRPAPDLDRVLATVLFTDIVGSTKKAAELGDAPWGDLLGAHNDAVRREFERFRGREVVTTGDGFLATFDGPARAVRCARAICEAVRPLGLEVRAGCHTGEIELVGADVGGIAVHIGARVGALAGPSEVLVSSTVKDLVAGSGLVFEDRGEHELKGVPDRWHIYAAHAPSAAS